MFDLGKVSAVLLTTLISSEVFSDINTKLNKIRLSMGK